MLGVLTSRLKWFLVQEEMTVMPLMYPIKRVFRNWKLFTAFLIGIALAATFFASIDVKANLAAENSLNQQLKNVNSDLDFNAYLNYTQFNQAISNVSSVNGVKSVDVLSRFGLVPGKDIDSNYSSYLWVVSFPDSSQVYNEWTNKPIEPIGENQTYIVSGTPLASHVKIGDNITTQISFPTPMQNNWTYVYLNLTVAGFADLTDKGYSLTTGNSLLYYGGAPLTSGQLYNARQDTMIIGWNSSLLNLWSTMGNRTVDTTFMINIDHSKLLSPWNVQASLNNVNTVASDIQNKVLSKYETYGYVNNNIQTAILNFQSNFQTALYELILFSLPVFFVAWYLGSTVADVSFNMRRREIGLLSTKGLSSGQIQRMFLAEAITVGCIGGAIGVIGGLVLNQAFTGGFNASTLFNSQTLSPEILIFTVVFGVLIGLVSMFPSARRASKLPTVEALRDYLPSNADQPYRKRLPWIAVILGGYKIVTLILGISVTSILSQGNFSGGFFLSLVLGPLGLLDTILTFVGPLLFCLGYHKTVNPKFD